MASFNAKTPIVVIEPLRYGDLDQLSSRPTHIQSETRKMDLQFAILSLSALACIEVRYRHDDHDNKWFEVGPSFVATHPRLPPEEHCFHERANFGEEQAGSLLIVIWQILRFRNGTSLLGLVANIVVVCAW